MRYLTIAAIGMTLALAALTGCGLVSDLSQAGQEAATAAAVAKQTADVLAPTLQAGADSLRQTADALAPTLEAQAPGLRQTLETLAPTLQAQAPEVRATLEALATEQPLDGVAVRQTVEALTGGSGAPSDIPVPGQRRDLLSTPTKLTYTTSVAYGALLELYQGEMPERGWEPLPNSNVGADAAVLRYRKDGRTATITIAKLAEGTTVDITIEQ